MDTNDMHVHQFRETIVPPTCTACGYTAYTCDCGYEYKNNFKPVVAHTYEISETTPATCTEPGSIVYVCSVCGETYTQTLPPLGHSYSEWVVKSYPTCQEPGAQIRKCQRCSVMEESAIAPMGHRCAPQTARYVRGKLVEFFCENCGQTISYANENLRTASTPMGHWPTRILLLLAIAATVSHFCFMLISRFDPVSPMTYLGSHYVYLLILMAVGVFLFLDTDRIKASDRYTRWLGAITLMFAIHEGFNLIENIAFHIEHGFDFIPTIWQISELPFLLLLTFIFFLGGKKKTWLFFVLVSYKSFYLMSSIYDLLRYSLDLADFLSEWYIAYLWAGLLSNIFLWAGMAMLIAPWKKSSHQEPTF